MSKETAGRIDVNVGPNSGRLPVFNQIAQGFLETLISHRGSSEVPACLRYLDGKVKIDGASYSRRVVVLAMEDLKQQIELPSLLASEAYELMRLLELDPIPELKLYRDLATAILRMDSVMRLARIRGALEPAGRTRVYH
jgi:hypothetical protein